jgi:hypothetical protein
MPADHLPQHSEIILIMEARLRELMRNQGWWMQDIEKKTKCSMMKGDSLEFGART